MRTILLLFLLTPCMVQAQTFTAKIGDLAFMEGTWTLHHEWGDMEEYWSGPAGDNMMCSYRCVKDGKIVFYEFVVIEQMGDVPVMKLRHFKPGSIGWEDKDKPYLFPLTALVGKKAVFRAGDGSLEMSYERTGEKTMKVLLSTFSGGRWKAEEFDYVLLVK